VYPFHHRNRFFNIITHLDLTFPEVRAILDYLMDQKAFSEDAEWESAQMYRFTLGRIEYEVDVSGYEVVVYRREESPTRPEREGDS
jgi:hypothetical protein